jgi:tricorn protease
VTEKVLFWLAFQPGEDHKGNVEAVTIGHDEPEVKTVADNVTGFELSADRKKLLLQREKEMLLADATVEKPDPKKSLVDLAGWTFAVNPRDEWRQMFVDAWRLERDYFYDREMHGLNWPAIRQRYEPLLPRVTDRNELDDLIAQMVSELSALHIFVTGGDVRKGPDDIAIGRLGAALARDVKAGGYRVERVYRHDPDEPERASPLARPGVDVKAGDSIVSVDDSPTLAAADNGELLRQKVGRQVLLGSKTAKAEQRKVVVVPMSSMDEGDLRYHEWEYSRRRRHRLSPSAGDGRRRLRVLGAGVLPTIRQRRTHHRCAE